MLDIEIVWIVEYSHRFVGVWSRGGGGIIGGVIVGGGIVERGRLRHGRDVCH